MPESLNRLLVIDDQPDLCEFIAEAAQGMGFAVRAVTEPDVFRRACLDFKPTVVVLDLQMPGADGIELLRYLASQGSRASVLVASGMDERVLATAEQVGRMHGLSMLGALQKPILLGDLEATLRKVMRGPGTITAMDVELALERKQIEAYYQPKATRVAPSRWIVQGVEVLARWHHPQRGPISPAVFVPVAENNGLIRALTERILDLTLKQMREWQDKTLSVAINLSPQLLNDRTFPDHVEKVVAAMDIDPQRIVFEITETAAMSDPATTMDVLTRLRVKNFGLSIDDFGTGYSSLKQLYLMPFSELKVDISFVRDVCEHDDARTMVETMVLLAHKLRLTACAEGVESQAILDFLNNIQCDRAQGYFIGRPMPGAELLERVRDWNARQPEVAPGEVQLQFCDL